MTASNTIGVLGTLAVSNGGFTLVDAGSLSVAGLVSGPAISLSAATIAIPGTISATNLLALGASSGGIFETGAINAGTLISLGTIAGGATLTGVNAITTLGNFAAPTFRLNNGTNLAVAGLLSAAQLVSIVDAGTLLVSGTIAPSGPDSIGIGLTGDVLNIAGLVSDGGAGTVSLVANTGSIGESGGTLIAGTLSGAAAGTAALIGANTVGTLTNFAVTGSGNGFELTDTSALVVAGAVTAPGNVYLQDSATGITIAAQGSVGAGQLASFLTDRLTIASTGSITGATFELAPNKFDQPMTLGEAGAG